MTNFSKCCGGNGMKPERHCQDCGRTWGRTKKELVELIDRERREHRVATDNCHALGTDLFLAREELAKQWKSIAEMEVGLSRRDREMDEMDKDIRTATDHADRWSSELTAERAAHKATREMSSRQLAQIEVDRLVRTDLESQLAYWRESAVNMTRHYIREGDAADAERDAVLVDTSANMR